MSQKGSQRFESRKRLDIYWVSGERHHKAVSIQNPPLLLTTIKETEPQYYKDKKVNSAKNLSWFGRRFILRAYKRNETLPTPSFWLKQKIQSKHSVSIFLTYKKKYEKINLCCFKPFVVIFIAIIGN